MSLELATPVKENMISCNIYTVKPLNIGHLWVLKNLFVLYWECPLLGGNIKKIVIFGTKRFVRYSRHVRCTKELMVLISKVLNDCLPKERQRYICIEWQEMVHRMNYVINSKKQELRLNVCLWYIQFQKSMKIVL